MSDLFTAIQTTLTGIALGGIYLAQAPPKDAMDRPISRPYMVMVDLGDSFEFTSGTPYIETAATGAQASSFAGWYSSASYSCAGFGAGYVRTGLGAIDPIQ